MKKVITEVVLLALLAIIATGCGGGQTANKSTQQAQTDQVSQPKQPVIPGTLGFTSAEFKDRFNKAATELGSDLQISNLTVQPGSVQDSFEYQFTNNLGIIGAINKADGSVRDIVLDGSGDGTVQSVMNIIVSMGIVIAAVDPSLSPSDRGDILKTLGIGDSNADLSNLSRNTVRNGKKYGLTCSQATGIQFGVEDANDKG